MHDKKICLQPDHNSGLLPPKVMLGNYQVGGAMGIEYKVRLEDTKWNKYSSRGEYQYVPFVYDSMSCTNFGTMNSIETQINFLKETGQIPEKNLALAIELGYFDETGRANFNDAFSAVMSGTTPNGNYVQNPAESARTMGVLPQKDYIDIKDVKTIQEWLDPSKITEAMKAKAKRFLDIFDIKWEWVVTGMPDTELFVKHLKQSPLTIASPVCPDWNVQNGIVGACQSNVDSHCTTLSGATPNMYFDVLDHYDPLMKRIAWAYPIHWAIKIVVTPKTIAGNYIFTTTMRKGMKSDEVKELQKRLNKELGFALVTDGNFGTLTDLAVKKYQANHNLVADGVVGAKTRAELNK